MPTSWDEASTRIFVSYSHKNREYVDGDKSLVRYLSGLERDGAAFWFDRDLTTGPWDTTIREKLNTADIVLVLVSQWLLDSEYVRDVEIQLMLERMRSHGLKIVPVMLAPSDWKRYGWLANLQHLPDGDKTIATNYTSSGAREGLYLELLTLVRSLLAKPPAEQAIEAMAGAVNVINALEPEYRALLNGSAAPQKGHGLYFEGAGDEVRVYRNNVLDKTITAATITHLQPSAIKDIVVMQREMRGFYEMWFELYRRRNEPGVSAELRQLASAIKPKLLSIIQQLEALKLDIEDHYRKFFHFLQTRGGSTGER